MRQKTSASWVGHGLWKVGSELTYPLSRHDICRVPGLFSFQEFFDCFSFSLILVVFFANWSPSYFLDELLIYCMAGSARQGLAGRHKEIASDKFAASSE